MQSANLPDKAAKHPGMPQQQLPVKSFVLSVWLFVYSFVMFYHYHAFGEIKLYSYISHTPLLFHAFYMLSQLREALLSVVLKNRISAFFQAPEATGLHRLCYDC